MQVALSTSVTVADNSMMLVSLILALTLTNSVQYSTQSSIGVAKEDLQTNSTITPSSVHKINSERTESDIKDTNNSSTNTTSRISNGGRDPKILSLFQNLLRIPLHLAGNQYSTAESNTNSWQQQGNHYHHQPELLHKQQQNYYEYYPTGHTQTSPVSSSTTNVYNTIQASPQVSNQLNGQMIPKFAFGEFTDLSSIANFLSFGTMEGIMERVTKFDQLRCIPKIMCQMIAKRQEDAERDSTSTTTSTTTTRKPSSRDSNTEKEERKSEDARFIKIQGVDTALGQFVKFLDVMQLKDWSFYPYLQGAYEGHQVKRSDECATKYSTCPFSDDQLVYYFNNYNGGFFQSLRSYRKLDVKEKEVVA